MTAPAAPCPGCGLLLAPSAGPTHPYIGASAACWALHGELLASGRGGGLAVDAYAVQHPGVPERRAIQSVALHLVVLHVVLERGEPLPRARALMTRLLARPPAWRWLEPPRPNGTVTVRDALAGTPVEEWARDVWGAWSAHHATVRAWAGG